VVSTVLKSGYESGSSRGRAYRRLVPVFLAKIEHDTVAKLKVSGIYGRVGIDLLSAARQRLPSCFYTSQRRGSKRPAGGRWDRNASELTTMGSAGTGAGYGCASVLILFTDDFLETRRDLLRVVWDKGSAIGSGSAVVRDGARNEMRRFSVRWEIDGLRNGGARSVSTVNLAVEYMETMMASQICETSTLA
jgi:hypothetical protein